MVAEEVGEDVGSWSLGLCGWRLVVGVYAQGAFFVDVCVAGFVSVCSG